MKHILRYFSGTRHWGIVFRRSGKTLTDMWDVVLYVDSSHASDPDRRRSRYGYIIMVNNNPVAFGTGMRPKCSASTPEAEYVSFITRENPILAKIYHTCEKYFASTQDN